MPTTKLSNEIVLNLITLRNEYGMSYQKLADWVLKTHGISVTGFAISSRIRKIQKGA